ncbi:U3 small nucleolar RNA-associated protein NOL7 [Pelodytes ibericus]
MRPEQEYESSSEGEEAPEEVTFQNAKTRAEESARKQHEAAKREKALLKEKRKLKQELFKEQKKRKLLSEDILQNIATIPAQREDKAEDKDASQEDGGKVQSHAKAKREKKLRPKKRLENNYSVVRLEDYSLLNLQEQKAKAFIQGKLYGKGKKRTTANEFLSVNCKRGVVKMPAIQFTDNSWAQEEKKKAEKFTLTWKSKGKL